VKIPQKTLARYCLAGVQNKLSRTAPNQSEERRMGTANERRGEWGMPGVKHPQHERARPIICLDRQYGPKEVMREMRRE
jgi:hypothetical protein